MRIPSGVTDQYIYFVAVDGTDFTSRETGLATWTVYRSRNGGAAAAMTSPTINEVDSSNMPGVYELLLDEDMSIDSGDDSQEMAFHITHAGMAPVTRVIELYRPKITAGETLDVSGGFGAADGLLLSTTIATVTTQTSFTLTAGSDQNDAYNGQSIVLYDVTNSDYPCVRRVVDYVGSTKRVSLDTAPNFTIAMSDEVKIFVSGAFASIKGATEVTDILIDDGSNPIEGAEVWITTGAAGTNTIWNGVTDASGVPKDVNDENPFLDPGTYYIWVQKSDYSFSNPTTLTVT